MWVKKNSEKSKAASAKWRAENPDKSKQNFSAWFAKNKEKVKTSCATYRATNPDKVKAATAVWRAANLERSRLTREAYRAANPGKIKAAVAAWAKANPEAIRINNQNRRAHKRTNGGVLSKGLSAKLFKLQRGKCACCGLPLGDNYHLDHVVPIALGGPNTDDNIQLLRQRCNIQKKAKHPVDFMQSRGYLL